MELIIWVYTSASLSIALIASSLHAAARRHCACIAHGKPRVLVREL